MSRPALVLSCDELVELTNRKRSDAQVATLKHMGIPFAARPDGSLVVLRSVAEALLGATMPALIEPEPELMP